MHVPGEFNQIASNKLTSLRRLLIRWYRRNQRKLPWRETGDPFRIWVSEVMLQQTQVDTVIPYYLKFVARFPDVRRLAEADLQAVLKAWEGLGYYARARNLHLAAKAVCERHAGKIPAAWETFRSLPGVGDYIAAAVLSIACGLPFAVTDGNVKRVLARLFLLEAPVNKPSGLKTFQQLASELLAVEQPGVFNQALMELGAVVCRPFNPLCDRCPLARDCAAFETRQVAAYPKKVRAKPVPTRQIVVGVVYKNGRVLITRRKPEGLLGGLWEFPGGKIERNESAEAACIREIREETGLEVEVRSFVARIRHAYTHFKVVLDVFKCSYLSGSVKLSGSVDHRWVKLDEIDAYPFPKANLKFIPLLSFPRLSRARD